MIRKPTYQELEQRIRVLEEQAVKGKRVEEALHFQKEMHQTILDNIPVMVAFFDREGRCRLINRCWQSTLGWSLEELQQHDDILAELYPDPEYRTYVSDYIKRAAGRWSDFKTRTRGGHMLDTSWINVSLSDGSTIGIGIDITARKQTEEILRESEKKFSAIFQYSPTPMAISSIEEGRLLDVNEQYTRLVEFPREELIGHTSEELHLWVDPEERNTYLEFLVQNQGSVKSQRVSVRTKSGAVIKVLFRADIITINNTPCLLSSAVDITDRLNAEEALAKSEELYRALATTVDSMCLVDRNCRYLFLNDGYTERHGLPKDRIIGRFFHDFHADEETRMYTDRVKEVFDTGNVCQCEITSTRDDRSFLVTYSPVKDPHGQTRAITVVSKDITERKRAEEALRESEERYRSLFEQSMDAFFLTVPEGRIISANPAACRMFGYTEEELVQLGRDGVMDTADPRLTAAIEERSRTGMFKGELTCVRRDKTRFPVELSSIIFQDSDGNLKTSMLIRDLSERKQMESALRDSETRFRELFDSMPNGVSVYEAVNDGENFLFKDVNKAGERITRVTRDEIAGKRLLEIFSDARRMGFLDALHRVWKTGRPELLPVREYKDRRISLWVENYIYRLPSGEIVAIYDDITARKQVEEALVKSEEQYRALATTADLMYLVDRDCRYLFLNDEYAKRIGLPKERLIGEFFRDFHIDDLTRIFTDSVTRVFDTGNICQHEHTSRRDHRHFLMTYSPVKNSEGQTRAVTVVSKDITERKRVEEALRSSRKQLRAFAGRLQAAREEERTQIAREIHDELGGALTAMKIDFSLLARAVATVRDTTLRDSLHARMDDMTKLVDATMRTVRRIATGLRPGILDDLGLVAALEWQLTDFQKRSGIRCEFLSSNESVALDRIRATALFRIAQEALTNVTRHARATEVRIRVHADAGTVLLEVEDNGVGIKEEEIQSAQSLGILGMRERAVSVGGRLTITGRPGQGTTVAVESPPARRGVQDQEADR